MLPLSARIEFWICWVAWISAFAAAKKRAAGQVKSVRAPGSGWGIVFQGIGFALVFIHIRPTDFEKSQWSLIASMILAPAGAWLGWAGAFHLGKQWRFEAALSQDHELIQSGPYRFVRHPIYASMLLLFLAAGAVGAWWPLFVAGLGAFLIGTEIRVRLEDRLLAGRFGERFATYRSTVPAYLPLVR